MIIPIFFFQPYHTIFDWSYLNYWLNWHFKSQHFLPASASYSFSSSTPTPTALAPASEKKRSILPDSIRLTGCLQLLVHTILFICMISMLTRSCRIDNNKGWVRHNFMRKHEVLNSAIFLTAPCEAEIYQFYDIWSCQWLQTAPRNTWHIRPTSTWWDCCFDTWQNCNNISTSDNLADKEISQCLQNLASPTAWMIR